MQDHALVYAIGDLAMAAGVTAPTLRYYERIGLLPRARRSAARQRFYDAADLARVTFIRRCRDLGFPLDTVRQLASLAGGAGDACGELREIAAGQLSEVHRRLADLAAVEAELAGIVQRCDESCLGRPVRGCTIPADLGGGSGCCAA